MKLSVSFPPLLSLFKQTYSRLIAPSGVRKRTTNALRATTSLDDIVQGHVYKAPILPATARGQRCLPHGWMDTCVHIPKWDKGWRRWWDKAKGLWFHVKTQSG